MFCRSNTPPRPSNESGFYEPDVAIDQIPSPRTDEDKINTNDDVTPFEKPELNSVAWRREESILEMTSESVTSSKTEKQRKRPSVVAPSFEDIKIDEIV